MKTTIKWLEEVTFEATPGSGHTVTIDGPPEEGGRNLGCRPMELMLMGLGGCTTFDLIHILKKGRHDVRDCEVEVDAERAQDVPKVFTKIHIHFKVAGKGLKESVVERAIQLSAEKYCSASIMLSKAVEITHSWEVTEVAD